MSDVHPLYTVAEVRAIESRALAALPPGTLMPRAGAAAAELAQTLLHAAGGPVLVLAGPGNNGGDALDCAARLADIGLEVTVLHFADSARLSADARTALERAQGTSVLFVNQDDWPTTLASATWNLIIDGLFGIGLRRALPEPLCDLVEKLDALRCPVLALDVPSGLDADTGNVVGENGRAVRATHTITFIGDKVGLHTAAGRDYAGIVSVSSLNIAPKLLPVATAFLGTPAHFASHLQMRRHASHKGCYGDALIIGGAHGMAGAVVLAARAAAKCGAGRVFAGFLDEPPAYDSLQPELMCRSAQSLDFSTGAVVLGPGLGLSEPARNLIQRSLQDAPVVAIDADALNLISIHTELQTALLQRNGSTIITPHPLEAARLLSTSVTDIQANRLHAGRELARRFKVVAVLKGSGTVIARPDGIAIVNATGNPALATAGSGDVLAGICGALLAQKWPAWEAANAAVWLHAQAADELVLQGTGPIGLSAGELIPQVRVALNRLTAHYGN